jgi:hypothetical protein
LCRPAGCPARSSDWLNILEFTLGPLSVIAIFAAVVTYGRGRGDDSHPQSTVSAENPPQPLHVNRRDLLGGLIHEYDIVPWRHDDRVSAPYAVGSTPVVVLLVGAAACVGA